MASVTSDMKELSTRDQESDSDQDLDLNSDDLYTDVVYLNTVCDEQAHTKNVPESWNVQVMVKNKVLFKIDTGAQVTAMSESAWNSLSHPGKLRKAKQRLCGPDRKPLDVLGTVSLTLTLNGKSCTQQIYIIRNLRSNLLGLPAIRQLQMLPQIDVIEKTIPDQFPDLFTGLGNMKECYTIRLKPDAKSYALFTPRHIPIPLRSKVRNELDRMERLGVISKVETPTPWCAGMVV